jgi:hypothetical protein
MDGPAEDDGLHPQYSWEKERQGSVRAARTARSCIRAMLQRIGLQEEQILALQTDATAHKRLLAYGVEVHLNIAWYVRAMANEDKRRRQLLALIILFGVGGICALPVYWFLVRGSTASWNVIVFQLTAFPAAAFGILRVLASVTDTRCRLGNFWRARSDLAEILYLFEQKWHQQFAAARTADFLADMDTGITAARQVTRAERQRFFDSITSPSDVLAVAQQSLEGVSSRFQRGPVHAAMMFAGPSLPAPGVPAPAISGAREPPG